MASVPYIIAPVSVNIAVGCAGQEPLPCRKQLALGLQTSKTLKYSQAKIDEAVTEYNQAKDKSLPTASVT